MITTLKALLLDRDNFPRMNGEKVSLTVSQIKAIIAELERKS